MVVIGDNLGSSRMTAPPEPTQEMLEAGLASYFEGATHGEPIEVQLREAYKAMLAAASLPSAARLPAVPTMPPEPAGWSENRHAYYTVEEFRDYINKLRAYCEYLEQRRGR